MLRKLLLGIAGAAALAGALVTQSAPASAQWIPPGGPHFRGPYAGPAPMYRHGPRHRHCWDRPVRVWNGWRYVIQYERVCRRGW